MKNIEFTDEELSLIHRALYCYYYHVNQRENANTRVMEEVFGENIEKLFEKDDRKTIGSVDEKVANYLTNKMTVESILSNSDTDDIRQK